MTHYSADYLTTALQKNETEQCSGDVLIVIEQALNKLEQLMAENSDVLRRLKER